MVRPLSLRLGGEMDFPGTGLGAFSFLILVVLFDKVGDKVEAKSLKALGFRDGIDSSPCRLLERGGEGMLLPPSRILAGCEHVRLLQGTEDKKVLRAEGSCGLSDPARSCKKLQEAGIYAKHLSLDPSPTPSSRGEGGLAGNAECKSIPSAEWGISGTGVLEWVHRTSQRRRARRDAPYLEKVFGAHRCSLV